MNRHHPHGIDLSGVAWQKSTYSAGNNECVEIANATHMGVVGVRDSKDPDSAVITFTPAAFATFITNTASRYDID